MIELHGKERCEAFAEYVIETGATVRQTASHFGISKSTVHKDLSVKLKHVNRTQYSLVKEILEINKRKTRPNTIRPKRPQILPVDLHIRAAINHDIVQIDTLLLQHRIQCRPQRPGTPKASGNKTNFHLQTFLSPPQEAKFYPQQIHPDIGVEV